MRYVSCRPMVKAVGHRLGRIVRGAALSLAAATAVFAGAAHAESPKVSSESRRGLDDSIRVELIGRIDARCTLSGGYDIDFGELGGGEGARAPFGLDCNVPFNIDIRSSRGGLAHVAKPQGEGPFAGLLEYDLHLVVPTLRPRPDSIEASYSSRQLLTKRTLSSGNGIAAGGGSLEFRMRHPEGAGLLAGHYTETVTLTVAAQM